MFERWNKETLAVGLRLLSMPIYFLPLAYWQHTHISCLFLCILLTWHFLLLIVSLRVYSSAVHLSAILYNAVSLISGPTCVTRYILMTQYDESELRWRTDAQLYPPLTLRFEAFGRGPEQMFSRELPWLWTEAFNWNLTRTQLHLLLRAFSTCVSPCPICFFLIVCAFADCHLCETWSTL